MISESSAIILFAICLLFSGFFSGSEVAFLSISQATVRTLVDQKKFGSEALAKLKKNTDHVLITILIGNNVANIGAAAIVTALAIERFGDAGVGIATGVVTFLMLIFGEIGPKTYAARIPSRMALFSARPILFMVYICTPLLWIFDGLKRLFAVKGDVSHPPITEEEIKQWLDVGEEAGTIEEEEHAMLYRVFRFTDTIVRESMTPRADVVMISETSTLEEAVNIFNETGYTRLPVYHEQIDNIIGILNVKDVFTALYVKKKGVAISDLIYEPLFVPESKKVDELLRELQIRKVHIAIVLDEYGTFAGIITVEDILEELVGEIMDEFDEEVPQVQALEDGAYLVDARAWVDRINEEIGVSLPEDDSYETIGGLLIDHLGHIPRRGEVVDIPELGIRLIVMRMRGRRIVEVKLSIMSSQPPQESDNG
jgi:putative hemolysin